MGGEGDPAEIRPVIVPMAATIIALRLVAVAGFHLFRYVDSIEYDELDFTGRGRRPWTTPLLYRLSPGDSDAVVILLQAVIGGLAWTALAVAVMARIRSVPVRIAAGATVGALSLTTTVTNWDSAKLSESLAISLTVALLAAWLLVLHRTTWPRVAAVLAVALPWLFVRQSLLPIGWAITVIAAALVIPAVRRHRDTAKRITLAAGLAALTLLASVSFTRNQEIARTNLTAVVSNRIAHDPDHLAWFRSHGMPLPPGGATDFGSLERDPAFGRWVRDEAGATYVRFLVTHPWFAVTGPVRDLFDEHPSFLNEPPWADEIHHETAAMLSPRDAYGGARPLLPRPVEALLLDPGHTGGITLALVLTLAWCGVETVRRGLPDGAATGFVVLALSALGLWAAWHGSTTELARLALVPALTLRIGLLVLLTALVDRQIDRRIGRKPIDGHPPA